MVGPCTSGFWRWMVLVLIVMTASVTGQGTGGFIVRAQSTGYEDPGALDDEFRNKSYIVSNGQEIRIHQNVYPYGRGHQAFILNEQTGEVIDKAVFDTHVGGTEAAGQLTTFLEGAAAGRTLAIVVHDSSSAAQVNLASYGSTITTAALGYRESYAMITQKGAKPSWFMEKKSARGAGPTIVEAYIPVNGGWTIWGAWTGCSVTCGVGTETRDRTCTNPAPENGGAECDGSAQKTRACDTGLSCPVDGGWSSWGGWSSCSVTCGSGRQSRHRTCTNPAPAYGGADCAGSAQETRQCNAGTCPVNGGWTIWGAWSGCSVTCGVGTETRDRTCTNPAPENGGAECDGSAQETRSCDTGVSCPDPWQEIFTTVKGTGQTVYYAWNASSDADVRHIKCPAVEHWESLNIQRVKVVLESEEGNVELIFNGTNTDKFNWFSKSRLLSSPWNDIKSQGQNNFSIEGTPQWKRSFYINRNFDGCANDTGWLVVADGGPNGACQWERSPDDQLPYIRYSKTIGYANFNGDDIATADRMVIYIDTPGNNVVCSCPSDQVVGADGTQCVDEINGCDLNPCVANAVCTDAPGTGATCTCGAGYEGDGNRNGTGCTGLGWGAIAGIVVGAILAVVLVTATLVFLIQKKRDGMDKEDGNVRDNDDKVYETIDDAYVASQRPGGGSDVCDVPMETLQPPAVQSRQPRGHHLQLKQQPGSGSDGYDAPMETFATPPQYENLPHPDPRMMSQPPGSGNDVYDVPMETFQPPAVQPPQYENLPNPDPS